MAKRRVAIIGVGYSSFTSRSRETREKSEVNFEAVHMALKGAGLKLKDIDVTVYTSVDGLEGVNRAERHQPCFGQNLNIPVYSVNTGGTGGGSAVKEAYHLIAAGMYDTALVAASCTWNTVVDMQQIFNTAMDPLIEKPIGPNGLTICGLFAMQYMEQYGWGDEIFSEIAAQNHSNGVRNPYAHLRKGLSYEEIVNSPIVSWPVRRFHCCPDSSGSCSLILAPEEKARDLVDKPVWIESIGSTVDTFLSGYRDYSSFDKLEMLSKRMFKDHGIGDPIKQLDVAEPFIPYAAFEPLAYEALGFCEKGKTPELIRNGVTSYEGQMPVCPGGGVLCTNSGISASLTRWGEVAMQLMGTAEGRQVQGDPKLGIAHAWGGSNGQFHVLSILRRD